MGGGSKADAMAKVEELQGFTLTLLRKDPVGRTRTKRTIQNLFSLQVAPCRARGVYPQGDQSLSSFAAHISRWSLIFRPPLMGVMVLATSKSEVSHFGTVH